MLINIIFKYFLEYICVNKCLYTYVHVLYMYIYICISYSVFSSILTLNSNHFNETIFPV